MGKSLDKKLGVWGKDKIIREDRSVHAKDYYCVRCYENKKEIPAVKLYPVRIDQDNPPFPYCQKCLDDLQFRMMVELGETPLP